MDDGCGSGTGGGTGGGGIGPTAVLFAVLDALIQAVRYSSYTSKKDDDKTMYYGMDLYGGTENIITEPMTFDQAVAWAIRTAASGKYTERESWGLYTQNKDDAMAMAFYLGKSAQFTHDKKKKGHYAHFHTAFRQIYGIPATNFHMWYGEKGV